jgi:CheY-like chemotaxis protein
MVGTNLAQQQSRRKPRTLDPKLVRVRLSGGQAVRHGQPPGPDVMKEFCGDPPLPVVRLTPATGHRVFFWPMNKKILLVDDDPGVRRMLLRVLEEEDYLVFPAGTGREALQRLAAKDIDLMLLDLSLPLENGWEIFQRLNAENPCLPVIIITARSNQLFPAMASGVGALMEKPLDLPRLLRTIADLLAEPIEARLARTAGRSTEFHYLPPKS